MDLINVFFSLLLSFGAYFCNKCENYNCHDSPDDSLILNGISMSCTVTLPSFFFLILHLFMTLNCQVISLVPSSQRFDILQALVNYSTSPSLVRTLFSSNTMFK